MRLLSEFFTYTDDTFSDCVTLLDEAEGEPAAEQRIRHSADIDTSHFIELPELLRAIQFYNSGGVYPCGDPQSEDGYCTRQS